jgi:hypothetical protein
MHLLLLLPRTHTAVQSSRKAVRTKSCPCCCVQGRGLWGLCRVQHAWGSKGVALVEQGLSANVDLM